MTQSIVKANRNRMYDSQSERTLRSGHNTRCQGAIGTIFTLVTSRGNWSDLFIAGSDVCAAGLSINLSFYMWRRVIKTRGEIGEGEVEVSGPLWCRLIYRLITGVMQVCHSKKSTHFLLMDSLHGLSCMISHLVHSPSVKSDCLIWCENVIRRVYIRSIYNSEKLSYRDYYWEKDMWFLSVELNRNHNHNCKNWCRIPELFLFFSTKLQSPTQLKSRWLN